MELFTLDQNFRRQDLIEDFYSVIWTERFSEPGEVQLSVPATPKWISLLEQSSFLATPGTKEVMLIETHNIEKGVLTVTGPTLLDFFKHRIIRASADPKEKQWTLIEASPGSAMRQIVQEMCISGGLINTGLNSTYASLEVIPNLVVGDEASYGPILGLRPIDYGEVYEQLKKLADEGQIGMTLYLNWATDDDYELVFKSWDGVDRTRFNVLAENIVSFSPATDSLADLKELNSVKGYKNVCYAFNTVEDVFDMTGHFGVAYADSASASTTGFRRRSMVITDDEFKSSDYTDIVIDIPTIVSVLVNKAQNALANNNYTKVVDGEVVPQVGYEYGVDYTLGDIVELQGHNNEYQRARITEYIRTQDASGEKAYPTVSVIV